MSNRADRIKGSIFGVAYGDALGAEAEFMDLPAILKRWGPGGPRELEGDPALITDDTQMATAVGEAFVQTFARPALTVNGVQRDLSDAFAAWFHSSDNTRAPGLTCLGAAARLSQGFAWQQCTIVHSKGCGANMRVTPVGLIDLPEGLTTADGASVTHSALAQMQAALTHGHPTALAAADLTAHATRCLLEGMAPGDLLETLQAYAERERFTYHEKWLGMLWEESQGVDTPSQFIAQGWSECARSLKAVERALENPKPEMDPCEQVGGGWIAEEALAAALLSFLLFPNSPVDALNRAAVSRGDSDSIAAITGAFTGATHGFDAFPASWYGVIETRERLDALASALHKIGSPVAAS
ncbi:MAG: ADP-ribosylglycohydrolase [Bradymonadia bacterium]|jgi:ADP-ribosylglycohydrolase